MTPERWQQVKNILKRLDSLPPEEQSNYLHEIAQRYPAIISQIQQMIHHAPTSQMAASELSDPKIQQLLKEYSPQLSSLNVSIQETNLTSSSWKALSEEQESRVNEICEQYEKDWKNRQEGWPRVEDYANGEETLDRVLLPQLIQIEQKNRAGLGETIDPQEYRERFGHYSWLEKLLFSGSGSGAASTKESMPSKAKVGPDHVSNKKSGQADTSARMEIAGYEILGELGRGGMGVVYKARQQGLNRLVALKMILHADHAGPERRMRFEREAQAIARLDHPNIVQIYEIGEYNGTPFFSLEYVTGGSLDKKLKGKPFPISGTVKLVEVLARGMHEAHRADVIHRDLKPANILIADKETPKITDFGLAKNLDEEGNTRSGAIMGTPSYMAPEQAAGETHAISPKVDVYALGAILYELLTGRPPFKAATTMDTLMQVMQQDPIPPSQLREEVAKDLETICLKCLEKDPRKRYESAELLAEELRRFQNGEPVQARPIGRGEKLWRWCKRNRMVAGLVTTTMVLLLTLTVGAIIAAFQIKVSSDEATEALNEKEIALTNEQDQRKLAQEQTKEKAKALAALKKQQVGQSLRNGWQHHRMGDLRGAMLWFNEALRNSEEGSRDEQLNRLLIGTFHSFQRPLKQAWFDVRGATFSPDNRYLAVITNSSTARVWEIDTGLPVTASLKHGNGIVLQAWFTPDGKQLITSCSDGKTRAWNVDPRQSQPFSASVNPRWSQETGIVAFIGFPKDDQKIVMATLKKAMILKRQTGVMLGKALQPGGIRDLSLEGNYLLCEAAVPIQNSTQPVKPKKDVVPPVVPGIPVPPDQPVKPEDNVVPPMNPQVPVPPGQPMKQEVKPLPLAFQVWNIEQRKLISSVTIQAEMPSIAKFSPDGKTFVTVPKSAFPQNNTKVEPGGQGSGIVVIPHRPGREIPSVYLWDTKTGKPLAKPLNTTQPVVDVDFSNDGRILAVASATPNQGHIPDHTHSLGGIQTISGSGEIRAWRLNDGKPTIILKAPVQMKVDSIAVSPDDEWVVTASPDGTVQGWNTTDPYKGDFILFHHRSENYLHNDLSFSPSGKMLMSACGTLSGGEIRLWDLASKTTNLAYELPESKDIDHIAFSKDEKHVYTPSKVWNLKTGKQAEQSVLEQDERVWITSLVYEDYIPVLRTQTVMQFSPYGLMFPRERIVTVLATEPKEIHLPKYLHETLLKAEMDRMELPRLAGSVRVVATDPFNRLLLTESRQQMFGQPVEYAEARVWNAETGAPITPPLPHRGSLAGGSFSRDGKTVVTWTKNSIFQIWDIQRGLPITAPLTSHDLLAARLSPTGTKLVTVPGWSKRYPRSKSTPPVPAPSKSTPPVPAPSTPPVTPPSDPSATSTPLFENHGIQRRAKPKETVHVLDLTRIGNRATEISDSMNRVLYDARVDPTGNIDKLASQEVRQEWESHLHKSQSERSSLSKTKALAWHRARAEECSRLQLWQHTIQHVGQVLQDSNNDSNLLSLRGIAYAAQSQWGLALKDLEIAFSPKLAAPEDWLHLALLRLKAGQKSEYQQLCRAMFKQFSQRKDIDALYPLVWASILSPSALEPEEYEHLLKQVRDLNGQQNDYRGYSLKKTEGILLYRMDKYEEALSKLQSLTGSGPFRVNAFHIMCLAKLSKMKEAQKIRYSALTQEMLDRDERITRSKQQNVATVYRGWQELLTARLVVQELDELLLPQQTEIK